MIILSKYNCKPYSVKYNSILNNNVAVWIEMSIVFVVINNSSCRFT